MFCKHTREDFKACGLGDIGLRSFVQAMLLYPAFSKVWFWRCSVNLFPKGRIARLLARYIRARGIRGGCDLSPLAKMGARVKLPHPLGVVIGEGVVIGDDVTIYQNVTIGQRGAPDEMPQIGDGVVIYAGACVLGGVKIGKGAVIGANAVVTKDVAAGDVVAGLPAQSIKTKAVKPKKIAG